MYLESGPITGPAPGDLGMAREGNFAREVGGRIKGGADILRHKTGSKWALNERDKDLQKESEKREEENAE